jgi:hypothetical protein
MRRITMMDDARTEGKRKGLNSGNQMGGQRRLFVHTGIMVLAVAILFVMNVGVTPADDQPIASMTIGYQDGTITAIHEKTLDINGRAYGLMPDVVILSHRGRIMSPSDLVVTAEVKFHVTKEDNGKIDKMIVTLPR